MPGDEGCEPAVEACLQDARRAVDCTEQRILARHAPAVLQGLHGAERHLIVGRPYQRRLGIALEQLRGLLECALAAPFAIHQLAQTHLRVLGQGAAQALLTSLCGRRIFNPRKRQQVQRLTGCNRAMAAQQVGEHQVTGLLVIGHQAADPLRVFVHVEHLQLSGRQRIVHDQQLDPAAQGHAQDLRSNVLFVDEHQVVRAVFPLQGFARLGDGCVRVALGITHTQIQAEVLGGGLHELRVGDPESFGRRARVKKHH